MTLSCVSVLGWRPDELGTAADRLRARLAELTSDVDRIRAARHSSEGHWRGVAAEAARQRLCEELVDGDELLEAIGTVRRRLDGAAQALTDARERVRTLVEAAQASGFLVADEGTVHPPYLPPPGTAPDPPGGLGDYLASYDARADALLHEAAERTDDLRRALLAAEEADRQQAVSLRRLPVPDSLAEQALRIEPSTPDVWGAPADAVVFPAGWRPWPALERGSDHAWSRQVTQDGSRCLPGGPGPGDPDDAGTGYHGGGFATGPDGRRYPLVVPQVAVGGALHRSNANVGDPLVADLLGLDGGWHQVGRTSGVDRFGQGASGLTRLIIGGAGATGLSTGSGTGLVRRTDLLPRVTVDVLGAPSLARPGPARPQSPGLVQEDPGAQSVEAPGVHPERVERAGGVLSLVANAAGAAALVEHLDDHLTHGYTLTLQQNEDGRRRALLDLYDVYDDPEGHIVVQRHLGYVGTDGTLRLADAAPLSTGPVVSPAPER